MPLPISYQLRAVRQLANLGLSELHILTGVPAIALSMRERGLRRIYPAFVRSYLMALEAAVEARRGSLICGCTELGARSPGAAYRALRKQSQLPGMHELLGWKYTDLRRKELSPDPWSDADRQHFCQVLLTHDESRRQAVLAALQQIPIPTTAIIPTKKPMTALHRT